MHFTHDVQGVRVPVSRASGGAARQGDVMSKPWEVVEHAEIEARLEAARQMRRDELGPWLADAGRRLVNAIAFLGSGHGRGAHHQHPTA